MRKVKYTTRKGIQQFKPVVTEAQLWDDDNIGFCLACGDEAYGVEPDARRYACESCGKEKVYGLSELVCMGLVVIKGEEVTA